MKTIRFYIDSIPKEEDYQFVNQIFDEIHADDPKIKDIILATIASGPMNAFKYMQLFYKTNHITQTKLARIVCELEIALSRKEISECKTILTKAQDIV